MHKGDVIAVVDTAKSAIEVESFHSGTVERLVTPEGETVPVGAVLAVIRQAAPEAAKAGGRPAVPPAPRVPAAPVGAQPAAPRHEPPALAVAGTAARAAPPATPLVRHEAAELGVDLVTVHGSGRGGAITRHDVERAAASMSRDRVTPLARRLAAELGVDLKIVTGSGAGGAVRADDVRRAATAGRPAEEVPGPVTPALEARLPEVPAREGRQPAGPATTARRPERAAAMRLAIARLMSRSKREIPHYYVSNTVDLGVALSWLRERNRSVPMSARMIPAALLLKGSTGPGPGGSAARS